ncbi:hypothetical protein [Natrinema versiforme]|uniref:Putative viral structural protein n=1 Tax=Natrinema versiforme icosahedral virus 1 TaxID=2766529 RepID=A0A7G2JVJ6_9VIRU|nr:hypothetical protein [Natrinema versiforme]YP_010772681.1 ORF26 [Natrinema versiforme icosahedral virus 1]DAC85278.1 TPA_asm: putative viral structural protein [Natrinema versiforme icosahedral virus 1]
MTERFEFATKQAADLFRDENEEHLCSDDDRRLKTVAVSSSAPDRLLEEAAIETAATRAERDGTSQLPLDDHERDSIDFSQGRASVPWARSIKAIMRAEGVDDWLAYLDPSLSVDEHQEVAQRAARDEQGDRLDAEDSIDDRLASVEGFQSSRCDSAETHCEEGEDDACEFLVNECGVDRDEVQSLLSDFEEIPADEIEGRWLGALKRAWNGYKGATRRFSEALETAREARQDAEAAAKAINGVRQAHGQDEIEEFHDLEEALTKLAAAGTTAVDGPDRVDGDAGDLEDLDVLERDVGSWTFEADDDQPKWRLERDRMDGGELLVIVDTTDRGRAEVVLGNLDELERTSLGEYPARREALEGAVSWLRNHPNGVPLDWFRGSLEDDAGDDDRRDEQGPPLADDRHVDDADDAADDDRRDDGQDSLLEDLPDADADGPSRAFRAAQQDGYLRRSESDEPDEREGLGQFGARRSDTTELEEFEDA